jgi:hypothetical protein
MTFAFGILAKKDIDIEPFELALRKISTFFVNLEVTYHSFNSHLDSYNTYSVGDRIPVPSGY